MNTIFLEKTIANNKYKSKIVTRIYLYLLYYTKIKKLVKHTISDGIKYNEIQDLIRAIKLIEPITLIVSDGNMLVQAYSSDKVSILSICSVSPNIEIEYTMDNLDRSSNIISITLLYTDTDVRYMYDIDNENSNIRTQLDSVDIDLLNSATEIIIKKYFLSE